MDWIFTTLKLVITGIGTKRDSNFYLKGIPAAKKPACIQKENLEWGAKEWGVIKTDYIMLLV